MYERLKSRQEFSYVYRNGQLKFGRFLAVHVLRDNHTEQIKIGISVSKKVGNAVQRNKVKRRLREIIRSLASDLRRGSYIVVSAKRSCAEADFTELSEDLRRVLQRLSLFNGQEGQGGSEDVH